MQDQQIISHIKNLKADHPYWGYRRIWANLNHKLQTQYNKKRIYRIMKQNNLLLSKETTNKALRTQKSKPIATRPNQYWGIDMTKVKINYIGWVYITIVIDWYSKKLVGYDIGQQSKSSDWLDALDMGVSCQFPFGIRSYVQSLSLVADNGCQPTSQSFRSSCSTLGIDLIFTSYCNPKGNAETERFMRTMKEECLWINEFDSVDELKNKLINWFDIYNNDYLHSKLKYKSPNHFEMQFFKRKPQLLEYKIAA